MSRHIEVQVFGDGRGDCVVFGERECSIQRRHQKVIEESPSPFLESRPSLRDRLLKLSEHLARSIRYRSAGTIEYLVDDSTADFYFLEMNTRLQVEHGITELRFGVDLVEMMLGQAQKPLDLSNFRSITPQGSALEARVYAENPLKNHMPSPGQLQHVHFGAGDGIRVDTWVRTGTNVTLTYDPLLAKIMAHGDDRATAVSRLKQALDKTKLQGIVTNADFLARVLDSSWFRSGRTTTNSLSNFPYAPRLLEMLSPGSFTTVQDLPGRVGIGFGIPESGPLDTLHAQLANCVAGNSPDCELLEVTFTGPRIRFHQRAIFAMAGADASARLDGKTIPMYERLEAPAGSILAMGRLSGGCRTYLAIRGGFPGIPLYLGSKSTSPVAQIGGLQGRQMVAGDMLELGEAPDLKPFQLPASLIPVWDPDTVYCLSGPHDSPDIMTSADVEAIFSADWTVSHQLSRIGVRINGPSLQWARTTGGEGGSHPSNYLDYPYAMGALNWTGDSPVIFPADAPSLGGFITSHVVPRAELFKVGQMKPGDKFRFAPISLPSAVDLRKRQVDFIDAVSLLAAGATETVAPLSLAIDNKLPSSQQASSAILDRVGEATIRQAGDSHLLIELLQSLQLEVRCRVQAVTEAIDRAALEGVSLVTPIGCSEIAIVLEGR